MKEPWQMTKAEWNSAREKVRPCFAQSSFTRASGSQATANMAELERLMYGVKWEAKRKMLAAANEEIVLSKSELSDLERILRAPVTHRDVIEKALKDGKPVPPGLVELSLGAPPT